MLKVVVALLLTLTTVFADPCSDGTYKTGHLYGPAGQCTTSYFICDHGDSKPLSCATGTVWNEAVKYCDHPRNVDACSADDVVDCKDSAGFPVTTDGYTKPSDCKTGIYYVCDNGHEITKSCAGGLIYDPDKHICDWAFKHQDCDVESTTTPASDDPITKPESTTTTAESPVTEPDILEPDTETTSSTTTRQTTDSVEDSTDHDSTDILDPDTETTDSSSTTRPTTDSVEDSTDHNSTDILNPDIETTDSSTTTRTTTDSVKDSTYHDSTDILDPDTETTDSSTTTRATTDSVEDPDKDTYIGFVVDDTGSMSREIDGVKQWIVRCVDGTSSSCANPPTGGWVMTSFNDPSVGRVIGPTSDVQEIIKEANRYYAYGGGDCPELGFEGLENAVNVIPTDNGGCKIFFFTDATAKDYSKGDAVSKLYQAKGCSFIPVLTGCCGICPAVCDTVDPEYYNTHVTDKTTTDSTCSTRIARSVTPSLNTLFYKMAEETGGSIYVTDKPRSSDDMLELLEEEVTLGFCGYSKLAGPSPDGYKCEEDCEAMGMCWDKSVSKCYCKSPTSCTPDAVTSSSLCKGEQVVVCDSNFTNEVIREYKNCTGYFLCNFGEPVHFNCAPGAIFSDESPSYCDHPYNVPPPCGTKSDEDK